MLKQAYFSIHFLLQSNAYFRFVYVIFSREFIYTFFAAIIAARVIWTYMIYFDFSAVAQADVS